MKPSKPPVANKFNPDCFISLVSCERGNPPKRSFGVYIRDKSGRAHVSFFKFLGKVSRQEAEWRALGAALRAASGLQKEKIELQTNSKDLQLALETGFEKAGGPLKAIAASLRLLYDGFRFRQVVYARLEAMPEAQALAEQALQSRK